MDDYDEFGNYIGAAGHRAERDSDSDGDFAEVASLPPAPGRDEGLAMDVEDEALLQTRIVLHEDKQLYPSADQVYGADVEVLIQDRDLQTIADPIIPNLAQKTRQRGKKAGLAYEHEFAECLMDTPSLIRNVAIVGALHHGKTSLADLLIEQSSARPWDVTKPRPRACDSRVDEKGRKVSIKCTPLSLALPDLEGKHYFINAVDTPGHPNFSDEVSSALRLCDAALLVVDVVEGVQLGTETAIRILARPGSPVSRVVLVLNKIDRLIHEQKLPVLDAYQKICPLVDSVNGILPPRLHVHPSNGSVLFASAEHGWCVSLECMALKSGGKPALAAKLWGDWYFDRTTNTFATTSSTTASKRTFVHFVLEPLYKVYAHVLGSDAPALAESLGLALSAKELALDAAPLLRLALRRTFPVPAASIVTSLRRLVVPPATGSKDGPVRVLVTKFFSANDDANEEEDDDDNGVAPDVDAGTTPEPRFRVWGLVQAGVLHVGASVRVIEGSDDDESVVTRTVTDVRLPLGGGRASLSVPSVPAGNWVLVSGVDAVISKLALLTDDEGSVQAPAPLQFDTKAVCKLAIEPLIPSELPKLVAGLRAVTKSYPLARTIVEESGEHVLVATGELALDCIMRDLRERYAGIEIKVSDPSVSLCETVKESSNIRCFTSTPNARNKFTMIASPLEPKLLVDLEEGSAPLAGTPELERALQKKYGYDLLGSRSLWAFGPSPVHGPNALIDDSLLDDKHKTLYPVRDSIVQGFAWACREGPLCDEPVRGVKFKLLDAAVDPSPLHRGAGQVIPTARRVCYAAMMTAVPRLYEPVFLVDAITKTQGGLGAVRTIVNRRRGRVATETPMAGTPFTRVVAHVPALDAFGLETDLRIHSHGDAFCLQTFSHWALAPGDPLDDAIVLRPLEPSPPEHLSRELLIKMRRRKGLSENVALSTYFDEDMLAELARREVESAMTWSNPTA